MAMNDEVARDLFSLKYAYTLERRLVVVIGVTIGSHILLLQRTVAMK